MIHNRGDMLGLPILFNVKGWQAEPAKLNEDRYEVFVEGEYVGEKTLYAQNEHVDDLVGFLEVQGFEHVEVEQKGDHIIVHSADHDEVNRMQQALRVYLNNR